MDRNNQNSYNIKKTKKIKPEKVLNKKLVEEAQ